jgi:putative aldouronate transport system permease protein
MVEDTSLSWRTFKVLNYVVLTLVGLACLVPLLHFLAVSFSDRSAAMGGLVTLWPIRFTVASYQQVLRSGLFFQTFFNSLVRVVLGTTIQMAVTILTAYPLARASKKFKGRDIFMWLLLIGMFTNWGLIPWWLVVKRLGLYDSMWGLVIPPALAPWNIIILMNFFREIPSDLDDAASVDGASHWTKLLHVYLPLSTPALATLTLFSVVFHWNSWFDGMVLINDVAKQPLQTFLRTIVVGLDASNLAIDPKSAQLYSDRAIRAASIYLSIVPVLLIYPFLQRYFVTGIKLGSVKE